LPAVLRGTQPGDLFEDAPKCRRVPVAGGATDSFDWIAGCLKEALGEVHPYKLQICLWPKSGGSGEPPVEVPLANPELLGELCDLDRFVNVRVDMLLNVAGDVVIVRPTPDRRQVMQ
jgi:hypothetical protein